MSTIVVAGHAIPQYEDFVRRYLGLPWSGGENETWAYRYFDKLPTTDPHDVLPEDVVSAGALGSPLGAADLSWFWEERQLLRHLLGRLPLDVSLADAPDSPMAVLSSLAKTPPVPGLSLLTKVLHRKRPHLVPMADKAVLGAYRDVLPGRGNDAWPALLPRMQEDLQRNESQLHDLQRVLALELDVVPSHLRLLDIIIWMAARPRKSP